MDQLFQLFFFIMFPSLVQPFFPFHEFSRNPQDLVFCPNVTVESLLPLLREASTDLAEHPVAATCRSGEEAEKLLTVMQQLGAQAWPRWGGFLP